METAPVNIIQYVIRFSGNIFQNIIMKCNNNRQHQRKKAMMSAFQTNVNYCDSDLTLSLYFYYTKRKWKNITSEFCLKKRELIPMPNKCYRINHTYHHYRFSGMCYYKFPKSLLSSVTVPWRLVAGLSGIAGLIQLLDIASPFLKCDVSTATFVFYSTHRTWRVHQTKVVNCVRPEYFDDTRVTGANKSLKTLSDCGPI